jgi:integrase
MMGVFINKRRGKNGKRYGISYRDAQGRLHQRIFSNDKKAADKEYGRILKEIDQGLHRPDARKKGFSEYAASWLEDKRAVVRESTWRAYRTHVQRYLLDPSYGLAGVRLHQVTLPRLRRLLGRLAPARSGLSPKTVNAILTTLGSILDQARRDRFLAVNPARDLTKLPVPHRKPDFLRPEEVQPLLDAASKMDSNLHTALALSIFTGLRRSELLALRFEDVVSEGEVHQLQITRSYQGGGRYGEPKSQRSRRNVNLASFTLRILREHRFRRGNPPGEALLFDRGDGWPMDPDHLSKTLWKRLLRRAGIRESLRWHDLRHTYATLLLNRGVNINMIKAQMGHSSIQVTLDRYAHLLPSTYQHAAEQVQEAVFGAPEVDNPLTIERRQG